MQVRSQEVVLMVRSVAINVGIGSVFILIVSVGLALTVGLDEGAIVGG